MKIDRIEDIRNNITSIMVRLCPDTRLPKTLEILATHRDEPAGASEVSEA